MNSVHTVRARSLKDRVNRAKRSIVLGSKEFNESLVAWYLPFLEGWVVVEQESSEALRVDEVEREVMVRKPVEQEQLVRLRVE